MRINSVFLKIEKVKAKVCCISKTAKALKAGKACMGIRENVLTARKRVGSRVSEVMKSREEREVHLMFNGYISKLQLVNRVLLKLYSE